MYEVISTSHGYATPGWDSQREDWIGVQHCETPEEMRDFLIDDFAGFMEYKNADTERDITKEEKKGFGLSRKRIWNNAANRIKEAEALGLRFHIY